MTSEQEIKLLKELLYCTKRSCNNCGKVNCENFQRQRIDCCGLWVSYKDYIKELEKENARLTTNEKSLLAERKIIVKENAELKEKIEVLECDNYNANCNLNLITDQLTKAKEIIKNLLILKNDHYGNTKMEWRVEVTEQAEQFIKEIEK